MQREDFERAMNLHFWAPFNLIRKVVPHMRRAGASRIVNISSIGGKLAVPHLAPYCAGKFALVGLSDSMRAELALDDIHVTTVTPGLMRTGSQGNAKFKGDHAAEYAWFSFSASLPVGSISDESAAARIVEACRAGRPSLIMPLPARIGIAGNALFPNLTGHMMKLVNRLLPRRQAQPAVINCVPVGKAAARNLTQAGSVVSRIGWRSEITEVVNNRTVR